MSSFSLDNALDKLTGYPDGLRQALTALVEAPEAGSAEEFVRQVLRFYQPAPEENPIGELAATANLRNDVGLDSGLIMEAVFLLEDLFDIQIANEDIGRLDTIGNVTAYLQDKLQPVLGAS